MPAELHLVTVVERSREHFVLHLDAERRRASQEAVEALMNNLIGRVAVPNGSLQERVLRKVALHIRVGEPAAEILRLSQEMVADVIVVGSCEHQGLRRRAWGSIPMTILSNAGCSVVLFRPGDFVQGSPTPKAELPRPFETEGYRLQLHHYHL
jgi:nucleotide-binding universal stress UspA family protein